MVNLASVYGATVSEAEAFQLITGFSILNDNIFHINCQLMELSPIFIKIPLIVLFTVY